MFKPFICWLDVDYGINKQHKGGCLLYDKPFLYKCYNFNYVCGLLWKLHCPLLVL